MSPELSATGLTLERKKGSNQLELNLWDIAPNGEDILWLGSIAGSVYDCAHYLEGYRKLGRVYLGGQSLPSKLNPELALIWATGGLSWPEGTGLGQKVAFCTLEKSNGNYVVQVWEVEEGRARRGDALRYAEWASAVNRIRQCVLANNCPYVPSVEPPPGNWQVTPEIAAGKEYPCAYMDLDPFIPEGGAPWGCNRDGG